MATSNYDDPYVMEDSDQESGQDSDDDISQWLEASTVRQKQIKRRNVRRTSNSSEDDFEKLMDSEVSNKIRADFPQMQSLKSKKQQEDEENDSLFYDPDMDDADQDWVNKTRASYHPSVPPSIRNEGKSKPQKTDALLNCPACMCAVCLDCQRHEIYHNQYRAMFTLNTLVDYGETLQFKKKPPKKGKRKRKLNSDVTVSVDNRTSTDFNDMETVNADDIGQSQDSDYYHPVNCANCKTKLAVYDSDEVYHFFNVLTSYT